MLTGEVNDLFLIDALYLTNEVQRFARGRRATSVQSVASGADSLGDLLRALGLQHYAACACSLSQRLRDPWRQQDLDGARAAAATLTARLTGMIEELRHRALIDDGAEFAAMWLAEHGGTDPLSVPGIPTMPVAPAPAPAPAPAVAVAVAETQTQTQQETPEEVIACPPDSGMLSTPEPGRDVCGEPEGTLTAPAECPLDRPFPPIDMASDAGDLPGWNPVPPEQRGDEIPGDKILHHCVASLGSSPVGADRSERLAVLARARRLHGQLAELNPVQAQSEASERIWQLVHSLRTHTRQIGSVVLERAVVASDAAIGAFAAAFEQLAVTSAIKLSVDPMVASLDVAFPTPSPSAMGFASERIGQCGGRIDASPLGWRLSLPIDSDRLNVVVVETEAGPLAIHALQFEGWVADDAGGSSAPIAATPGGRLLLRHGAVAVECSLRSSMASFSAPAPTLEVWRFELPPPEHWPCPYGWSALVADASGRVMPLLMPLAVPSGEQYQLSAFT